MRREVDSNHDGISRAIRDLLQFRIRQCVMTHGGIVIVFLHSRGTVCWGRSDGKVSRDAMSTCGFYKNASGQRASQPLANSAHNGASFAFMNYSQDLIRKASVESTLQLFCHS